MRQRSRKSARPHAQLHLPPLDAGNALTLVDLLERLIAAIWHAHGDRMAELRALRPAPPSIDPDYRHEGNPDAPDLDF